VSEIIIQICADIPDYFAHIFKHVIHTVPTQLDVYRISRIISLLKEAVWNRLYAMIWSLQYKTLLEHWNPKGVKKCPTFYGIWMFTSLPLYCVLSQISPFTPLHCFFPVLILIWSYCLFLNFPFHFIIIQYNLWDCLWISNSIQNFEGFMNYSLETTMLEVHLLSVISCTYFKVCFNTANEKIIHLW
jgi:hypothetical protein